MSKVKKQKRFQAHLKTNPTPAELQLKHLLHCCEDTRGKFEFQPMLYGYYPDFLNRSAMLIVEVDGWHHFTEAGRKRDQRRWNAFNRKGFKTIRFQNKQVMEDPWSVIEEILLAVA